MPRPTNFEVLTAVPSGQEGTTGPVGGRVVKLIAGASLNVGDFVYISAAGTVNKSSTALTYANVGCGVVVGGRLTKDQVVYDSKAIAAGLAAATVNQEVWVQIDGIAYVVSDAAISAVGSVGPGTTTAGRVLANTTAGQMLGIGLDVAAGAAVAIRVLIAPH